MTSRVIATLTRPILLVVFLSSLPLPLGSQGAPPTTPTELPAMASQPPHYILKSYVVQNAEGEDKPLTNPTLLDEFIDKLRDLMSEQAARVLSIDDQPPKCDASFPCEYIMFVEERPDARELEISLVLSPNPRTVGRVQHRRPYKILTGPNEPISDVRRGLLKKAAETVVAHDKLHTTNEH